VSMPNGADPLDRLHAADPVRANGVPDASLARVTARVQEHIMSDTRYNPDVKPTRGPLALLGGLALAGVAALAITFGSGVGVPAPTPDPGAGGGAAGGGAAGGGMASCLAYDTAELPRMEIVFDGTVTAIDGDRVTFDVNEGWKGAEGSITLADPNADVALLGEMPDFEVGGRYLVTATGDTMNACNYTLDYSADEAADWAAAF
jgi:hypothetical protein